MISFLRGMVIFSDGTEVILVPNQGVGYQVYFGHVLAEGSHVALYVSHVVKEAGEDLYGFKSLREKKLFEMLIQVRGVGPKSAFSLLGSLGMQSVMDAVAAEDKKVLSKAPGIGAKSAAQIILDLSNKIQKVRMYSNRQFDLSLSQKDLHTPNFSQEESSEEILQEDSSSAITNDAIMACKELGFNENIIVPRIQDILRENSITKAEQLVHLVLKGM